MTIDHETRFRPDLQGIRAIAVVLIVLFHAGVPGLSGGYIGVDVFFVLSGYLITGLLVRELGSTGGVGVASFYARRARRILPASFLVLAVTLIASGAILSPIDFASASKDVAASAIYVPNVRFALEQTDYWHPAAVSPVLHFWSLGVEEQFYLIWPAFLLVAWRLGARSTRGLGFWVTVVTLGSLLLGIVLTPLNPTASFYLLPTRAWELGLGAMLVFADGRFRTMPASISAVAGWTGLLMIGAAAVLFDAATPFPGVAALVPVVGTALLVAAGAAERRSWPGPLLASRPMQFFGRISYSLYLWHWPLIVLGAAACGRRQSRDPGPDRGRACGPARRRDVSMGRGSGSSRPVRRRPPASEPSDRCVRIGLPRRRLRRHRGRGHPAVPARDRQCRCRGGGPTRGPDPERQPDTRRPRTDARRTACLGGAIADDTGPTATDSRCAAPRRPDAVAPEPAVTRPGEGAIRKGLRPERPGHRIPAMRRWRSGLGHDRRPVR